MPLPRSLWPALPPSVHREVERRVGAILRATPVGLGSNSDVAAVVETRSARYFCKGASPDNPKAWMHRNEARVNAYLPAHVPRLLWQAESDGWLLLGFEHIPGRHPDLRTNSPDLAMMAATLSSMAETLTPCPVLKVQPATVRWADYVDPEVVDGDTLAHTDVTPHNFLIDGETVKVVDWSMPCRGASWIDTALMVIRLVRAGHAPQQAESWAKQVTAWSAARPAAIDAFAAGVAVLMRKRQRERPSAPHLGPLADAADSWTRFRAGEPRT